LDSRTRAVPFRIRETVLGDTRAAAATISSVTSRPRATPVWRRFALDRCINCPAYCGCILVFFDGYRALICAWRPLAAGLGAAQHATGTPPAKSDND
jgi:hypothetical protein